MGYRCPRTKLFCLHKEEALLFTFTINILQLQTNCKIAELIWRRVYYIIQSYSNDTNIYNKRKEPGRLTQVRRAQCVQRPVLRLTPGLIKPREEGTHVDHRNMSSED